MQFASNEERLGSFERALVELKQRTQARIGTEDVRYVRRMEAFSRSMEVIGRVLIHVSFEPVGFFVGVIALWLHKQLQATEIGHTALHGAYDRLPGAQRYASHRYHWEVPIDEASWRRGHNGRHHGATNVAGRDPDIHFGPVRLTEHTPWRPHHRHQLWFALLVLFPNFGFLMNLHFTGVADARIGNGRPERFDFLRSGSPAEVRVAQRRALRKAIPYYLKEYVLFPLLAGPFFWKVLLGNYLAEVLRDVYSAATIFCGHVGADTASYADGTVPRSRGERWAMQVEASNDFDVSWPVSVLCGALDLQIEHHLFPTFPPNRLRAIAPEVRAICRAHGVAYRSASWGRTLWLAFARIRELSRPTAGVAHA